MVYLERMFHAVGEKVMLVKRAYKLRIYPNKAQEVLIAKTIGCSSYIFNHFLAQWKATFKETGKGLTYNKCSSGLTQLKKELEWLKEVDSIALQYDRDIMQVSILVTKRYDQSQGLRG